MALAIVALVKALIADIITPIIGVIVGKPSFGDLTFSINASKFLYGDFINALITFLAIAAAVYFFIVMPYQRYQNSRGISSETKECPHCLSAIPAAATRCAHCTQTV